MVSKTVKIVIRKGRWKVTEYRFLGIPVYREWVELLFA